MNYQFKFENKHSWNASRFGDGTHDEDVAVPESIAIAAGFSFLGFREICFEAKWLGKQLSRLRFVFAVKLLDF